MADSEAELGMAAVPETRAHPLPPNSRQGPGERRTASAQTHRILNAAVILGALGYFVDIYDLILFSIVRIKSLQGIGVPEALLLPYGVKLLNIQMIGMLTGGILWGILGDKKGRLSVLFGSIAMYSIANIANGFVHSMGAYAIWRFIAGVGLAGELGAGVTLVSEVMSKENRGYGTMVVAGVGLCGGIVAGLIGDYFQWRTAYFIGGGMGLALLILRIGVYESGMFHQVRESRIERGNLLMIFRNSHRAVKYLCCIAIGVPIWYMIGILITFSPEFGKALGMTTLPSPGKAVLFSYAGVTVGDFASGWMSQYFKTRKKIALLFMLITGFWIAVYLLCQSPSLPFFYFLCWALGFGTGYWAIFVTMASEQFGTNIRATVTTTTPNFVRGSTVLLTSSFRALQAPLGIIASAAVVGAASLAVGLLCLYHLEETYGKDLNFCEE